MRKGLLVIVSLLCCLQLFPLGKPDLRCLEVNDAGHITLHWLAPSDMSDFARYEIYHATIGGNYSRIAVIMDATKTSYCDTAAQALTQSSSYCVIAISSNSQFSSDTISSIELYLTNLANGSAQLNWNAPITPPKPSYSTNYEVWKEYPATVWNLSKTTTALMAKDTNDFCQATVGYRIELADASGCKNVSRPERDIFNDLIPPKKPRFDSVSVSISDNTLQLGWQPSISADAAAYVIYHFENNVWIPIDTVFGYNTTYWNTTDYNPTDEIHHFRIAAMDDCANVSPMTDEIFNMQSSSQFDYCTQTAFISWTAYNNMPDGIKEFRIYYSVDGGAWTLAGTASATEHDFSFPGLIPNSDYTFFVQAVNTFETVSASSAKTSFTFAPEDNKDFVYIRSVSVVDNDYLSIKVSTGSTISFNKVILYRSVDSADNFSYFKTIANNGSDTYVFTDESAKVARLHYYYKAAIENGCGMQTAESNVAHNIILQGTTHEYKNYLQWNDYGYWENGVAHYIVERMDYLNNAFKEVGFEYGNVTNYIDDVIGCPDEGDQFIYQIKAYSAQNPYGFEDVSVSNQIIAYQQPIVYIASGFRPLGGIITTFKPYTSFVNLKDYNFRIYSREGNLVFETDNPEIGWDGKLKNDVYYPAQIFIYKISFSYGKDDYFEKSGTVTLVR